MNQPLKIRAAAFTHRAKNRMVELLERRPFGRGVVSMWRGLGRHDAAVAASAMAFDLFMAAIPMLALAGWVAVVVLRRDERALGMTSLLLDLTPVEVHTLMTRHLGRYLPGAVAPLALLGSIWLSSSAFHTLMSVFELAIGAVRRPWWKIRLIAIGCSFAAIFAFALTAFLAVQIAGGPSALFNFLSAGQWAGPPLGRMAAAVFSILAATTALAGFFRIGVHRPHVERRVWPGAALTVGIGGLSSYLLSYYAKKVASFSIYYGSLTAVAIVLVWLWIWCLAVVIGAELNAQLEGGDRH